MKFFFLFLFLTFSQASEKVFLCPLQYCESHHMKGKYQELKEDFYIERVQIENSSDPYMFNLSCEGTWLMSFHAPYITKEQKNMLSIPSVTINHTVINNQAVDSDDKKHIYRAPGAFLIKYFKKIQETEKDIYFLKIEVNEEAKKCIKYAFETYFDSLCFLVFQTP